MSRYLMSMVALMALSAWASPVWAQEEQQQPQRDQTQQQRDQLQRDQSQQRDQFQQSDRRQQARAFLGATIDNEEEGQLGAKVVAIVPNGPAAQAGLRNGDVITKVENKTVANFEDLTNLVRQHKPGDQLNIHVKRDGQDKTLTVTLRQAPARMDDQGFGMPEQFNQFGQQRFGQAPMGRNRPAFLGVQTEEITPQLKQERNLNVDRGILIVDVIPNSPAAQAGLRNDDVIAKIDGRQVITTDDLRQAVLQSAAGQEIKLDVLRGNNHREMTAQLGQAPPNMMQGGQPRYYGGFEENQFGNPSQEIQRLQQRIQQLERRLRQLEQNQQNQQNPRGGTPQ